MVYLIEEVICLHFDTKKFDVLDPAHGPQVIASYPCKGYHSTDYLLVLAILVLPCVPNSPKVIITASTIAVSTAAFSGILLT